MTVLIKEEKAGNMALFLELRQGYDYVYYSVAVCNNYGTDMYRTEKEYTTHEKQKALRTFNRYRKNYLQ